MDDADPLERRVDIDEALAAAASVLPLLDLGNASRRKVDGNLDEGVAPFGAVGIAGHGGMGDDGGSHRDAGGNGARWHARRHLDLLPLELAEAAATLTDADPLLG